MSGKILYYIMLTSILIIAISSNMDRVAYYSSMISTTLNNLSNQKTVTNYTSVQNQDNTVKKKQKYVAGTAFITTSNYANPKLKYYYLIPSSIVRDSRVTHPILVMVPGLDGDWQYLIRSYVKDFAERQGFIIIAPGFIEDTKNWESQTSYQYPAAWSGNALMQIINHFSSNHKVYPSKLYMFGFSAGAQFALRFTLLHTDIVQACASNGNGGRIIPQSRDNVRYFISVGTNDEKDRKDNASIFYYSARKLGLSVQYKEYPEGHELSDDQIKDCLEFFRISRSF